MKSPLRQHWKMGLLLLSGLVQMFGGLTGLDSLKAIGFASAASPAPKVFCDVDGLEPFASTFTLSAETGSGATITCVLDPARYGRLKGPYNRRNAYGALLSYAPRLPGPLFDEVARNAVQPGSPLLTELGLPADTTALTLEIRTQTRGRNDLWRYRFPAAP